MILVVDDNRELREALKEFLSLRGHAVESAENGNEALRMLTRLDARPTLIFLNLTMSEVDGWGLLAELRQRPPLADVPVVIMSGRSAVAQKANQAGAVAVVRKPAEPQVFLKIVDHFDQTAYPRPAQARSRLLPR